jgi:Fe-S oxidoreductase
MGVIMKILDSIKSLKELFVFGNTMYYPGCLTHFAAPDIEKNYIEILNKIGVDFILVPEFFCCGKPVANAGFLEDAQDLHDKNLNVFRKYGVKRIITNCPSCFHELKSMDGIKVEHITQVIARKLRKLDFISDDKITYQEPCHLGRKGGVYEEPRKIISALGFKLKELDNNRENSMCCGAGGGLKSNNPELSNMIAKKYLRNVQTKKIVTTCPLCYKQMQENAKNDYEVYELSQLILNKMNNSNQSLKILSNEEKSKKKDERMM